MLLFLFSVLTSAAPVLTHNLSSTGHLLERHQCVAGFQALACGFSERWSVGVSPWLLADYDMLALSSRTRLKKYPDGGSLTLQLIYFKTYHASNFTYATPYQMEALWMMWVRALPLAPNYTLHLNLHTNYYLDDSMPFSLRRPIPNRNQGQLNLSMLHEIKIINHWQFLFEAGFLDLAQPYDAPYLHMGASMGRATKNWEWHVGYSVTGALGAFRSAERRDYQQTLRYGDEGYNQDLSDYSAARDFAIHPEFSLGYFF